MRHIARIGPDAIRLPLLCFWFPISFVRYVLSSAMPVRLGGHPNKHRLIEVNFYALPVSLFWAAWDGHFVPDR